MRGGLSGFPGLPGPSTAKIEVRASGAGNGAVSAVRKARPRHALHPRMVDLVGERFGRLTAIRPTDERKFNSVVWVLRCDCGTTVRRPHRTITRAKSLLVGSCGCGRRGMNSSLSRDLTGQRFWSLVAIKWVKPRGLSPQPNYWQFQCDCGRKHVARARDVKRGNTKSCGCALVAPRTVRGTCAVPGVKRGDKFGLLTVTKRAPDRNGARYFHCRCDCGGSNTVRSAILVNGQVRSCGCLRTRGDK